MQSQPGQRRRVFLTRLIETIKMSVYIDPRRNSKKDDARLMCLQERAENNKFVHFRLFKTEYPGRFLGAINRSC